MTQLDKNPTGKDHIFIVSGGRTGTTFFGQHLSEAIDNCTSIHEPDIFYGFSRRTLKSVVTFGPWHMIIGRFFKRTGVRNLAQHAISGRWDSARLKKSILRHRESYYKGFESGLIIEAYYQWAYLLPHLHDAFPRCKSIGIVRDPRDWVRSWLNYGALYEATDPVKLAGQDRLTPQIVGDNSTLEQWGSMDSFAKLCWNWAYTNQTIYNFSDANPRCKLFMFEDIFNEAGTAMETLLSFCSQFDQRQYHVDLCALREARPANASTKSRQASWHDWTQEQARTLDQFCGPLMRKLGYGNEPEWQALLAGKHAPSPSKTSSLSLTG